MAPRLRVRALTGEGMLLNRGSACGGKQARRTHDDSLTGPSRSVTHVTRQGIPRCLWNRISRRYGIAAPAGLAVGDPERAVVCIQRLYGCTGATRLSFLC